MTPFGLFLESLRRSRQLQQVQLADLLWDYVDQSKRTIRLPDNATAEEYSLMRDMRRHLGALSMEQIEIIRNTLKLGGNSTTKPRIEIRSM